MPPLNRKPDSEVKSRISVFISRRTGRSDPPHKKMSYCKYDIFEKKISEFQKIRLDIPDIFIIFVYRAIHNRRNSIGAHPAGAGYDS